MTIKKMTHPTNMTEEDMIQAARKLFPDRHSLAEWPMVREQETIPEITPKELEMAERRLRPKKAPGPDWLRGSIVKKAINVCPTYFLDRYNRVMKTGTIPSSWKEARLVLIPKSRNDCQEQNYRPLCMLNNICKVLEYILLERILVEIEKSGDFAVNQFGFRKNHSTIDAILAVQSAAREADRYAWRHRRAAAMVALDVRNAFGTAPWGELWNA